MKIFVKNKDPKDSILVVGGDTKTKSVFDNKDDATKRYVLRPDEEDIFELPDGYIVAIEKL
jgi:hypothetical protein